MSKPDTMTQCRLYTMTGNSEVVTWIDTKYAKPGIRVSVEDFPGMVFEVKETYSTLDSEVVKKQQDYWRTHRKGTDI